MMADVAGDLQVAEPQQTEFVDLTDEQEIAVEPINELKEKEANGSCYDDLVLPTATIVKIIKDVLPDNSIIAKEAKEIARRVATYFILYVTDCASEIASGKKRKTILPADIISALKELDFNEMVETLNGLLAHRKSKNSTVQEFSAKKNEQNSLENVDAISDEIEIVLGKNAVVEVEENFGENLNQTNLDRAFNASDDEE